MNEIPRSPGKPRLSIDELDAALRAGDGCPATARLAAAAAGELAADELRALEAHAAGCAACAAELELARGFFEPAAASAELDELLARLPARPGAPAPSARILPMRSRPGARPARRVAWAAAASVLLAVALGVVALRDGSAPGLPDRPLDDVVRGGRIDWTTALGTLPAAPGRLAWGAVAGADRYRVEIFGVDALPIAAAEVERAEWTLAPGDRGRLETHVTYRVRVVALDPSGAELAASDFAELRIEPPR